MSDQMLMFNAFFFADDKKELLIKKKEFALVPKIMITEKKQQAG